MSTKQCRCGCYVPDRCHHCGEPLGELRNESAELVMLRAENDLVKRERDSAIKSVFDLRRALAGQQAIINGRRSGLGEWLREELAVYRGQLRGLRLFHGDWAMDGLGLATLAMLVYALATVAGQIAGGM